MSKEHFPLAEKLYAFIDKYNVVLKDNFCRKILETLLEVVPGLISAKPPSFEQARTLLGYAEEQNKRVTNNYENSVKILRQ